MDTTTYAGQFAFCLRSLREHAGLTVYALAKRAGLTPQFVSRIEAGERAPGWETACKLAAALGVGVGSFQRTPPEKSRKKS